MGLVKVVSWSSRESGRLPSAAAGEREAISGGAMTAPPSALVVVQGDHVEHGLRWPGVIQSRLNKIILHIIQ